MTVASPQLLQDVKVPIPMPGIEAFCAKWEVIEFALFGSVLREDFTPDSDVDVLVTFDQAARPTLFDIVEMQEELEKLFGRRVDLLERGGLEQCRNPYVRGPVLASLRVVYAR